MFARCTVIAFVLLLFAAPVTSQARVRQQAWVKDALQLKSLPRRNAAIVAMRAAVADGRDRDALLAIPEIREVPHEKNMFGSLVRVHLTPPGARPCS